MTNNKKTEDKKENGKTTIELTDYIVTLKDKLTWFEVEQVKGETVSGAKMDNTGITGYDGQALLRSKMKMFEVSIKEIKEKDTGNVVPYSDKWLKNLSQEDGEKLDDAVGELGKKK